MQRRLVLLYNGQSWGVYDDSTCPSLTDKGPFPNWYYREYSVDSKDERKAFRGLLNVLQKFNQEKTLPKKEGEDIFPELKQLLY